jgi:hypothetical protein
MTPFRFLRNTYRFDRLPARRPGQAAAQKNLSPHVYQCWKFDVRFLPDDFSHLLLQSNLEPLTSKLK